MTQWRKSSRSANSGQADCVEVAQLDHAVGLRDSKAPHASNLAVTAENFSKLVSRIKRNELDL